MRRLITVALLALATTTVAGACGGGDDGPTDQERCEHAKEEREQFAEDFFCARARDDRQFHDD